MTADSRPDPITETSACCERCSRPIPGVYYHVDDAVTCESCRTALAEPRATQLQRTVRALAFGCLAAAAGSLLISGVFAVTGLEFSILAIAVGHIVGTAVRKGSCGRGGWAYQSLAIGLTYAAISLSYIPLVEKEARKASVAESVRSSPATPTHGTPPMVDTITISASGPEVGRAIDSTAAARRARVSFPVIQSGTPSSMPVNDSKAGRLGLGRILFIAIVVPIAASTASIVSLLITVVALFEAWRLNRRRVPQVSGPFRLAAAEA